MDVREKLEILADAAKYDASCASSGSKGRRATTAQGVGSTEGMGICHSYTPDGRCVSLLKLLLTNYCLYDCQYCINRRTSGVRRARFAAAEVVRLTLDFYRRNYIEGLFLSSGIIRSPDYTMEQLALVARTLRQAHDFQGYIHLKTIPDADPELIAQGIANLGSYISGGIPGSGTMGPTLVNVSSGGRTIWSSVGEAYTRIFETACQRASKVTAINEWRNDPLPELNLDHIEALTDRTEIFLRVIGPRPNGFMWAQVVRFTPSRSAARLRFCSVRDSACQWRR